MNAELLMEKRLEKYYSRQELGDMIGVSRQAYTKWEKGKAEPSTENVLKLSQILEVSVDELLDETRKYSYSPSIVKNKKRRNKMIRRTILSILIFPIFLILCIYLLGSIGSKITLRTTSDKAFEQNIGYINYMEESPQEFLEFYNMKGFAFRSDSDFYFYDSNGYVGHKKVSGTAETYTSTINFMVYEWFVYKKENYLVIDIHSFDENETPQCAKLLWAYMDNSRNDHGDYE